VGFDWQQGLPGVGGCSFPLARRGALLKKRGLFRALQPLREIHKSIRSTKNPAPPVRVHPGQSFPNWSPRLIFAAVPSRESGGGCLLRPSMNLRKQEPARQHRESPSGARGPTARRSTLIRVVKKSHAAHINLHDATAQLNQLQIMISDSTFQRGEHASAIFSSGGPGCRPRPVETKTGMKGTCASPVTGPEESEPATTSKTDRHPAFV
jgi:hypothetical protein